MRKAQEILEQFGDGANWIFMQPDGSVWVSQYSPKLDTPLPTFTSPSMYNFAKGLYEPISWKHPAYSNIWCLGKFDVEEFYGLPWDKCLIKKKEKAIPYAKAVGCLGFFWNGDSMIDAQIGVLASAKRNSLGHVVYSYECNGYEHFKPIKRHEVKFFED